MHHIELVVFTLLFEYVFCTSPLINVHEGQLKGKQFLSRSGRNFFAFQGIPYGKPPVGQLRFKVCIKHLYISIDQRLFHLRYGKRLGSGTNWSLERRIERYVGAVDVYSKESFHVPDI